MSTEQILIGTKVTSLATRHRRMSADFPGWGAPDAADFLLETPAGITGVIVSVESHGSNPWTRYAIRFIDGSLMAGAVYGSDFDFIATNG